MFPIRIGIDVSNTYWSAASNYSDTTGIPAIPSITVALPVHTGLTVTVVYGSTISIFGTSSVSDVQILQDDTIVTSGTLPMQLDVSSLSQGEKLLKVVAIDASGNQAVKIIGFYDVWQSD